MSILRGRPQTVRYYIAFRIMKAAESYFDSVTCLSGPLSCYRKELIIEHTDAWLNQKFLGQPATFGDDRSMTNFILRTRRTGYQDTAICSTIVPSNMGFFLKQQMRWKRSWLRESLIAGTFYLAKGTFHGAVLLCRINRSNRSTHYRVVQHGVCSDCLQGLSNYIYDGIITDGFTHECSPFVI